MISAVDLREVRRKVSAAHFDDGLWDILLGMFITLFVVQVPLYIITGMLALSCFVGCYFLIVAQKRRTTSSMMGYIEIIRDRKTPTVFVLVPILIAVGCLLIFAMLSAIREPSGSPMFLALICYMVGYFVVIGLKRRITYPRIGYTKNSGNRKILLMLLPWLFIFPSFWSWYVLYLTWMVFPAIIAFVAYYYRVKRWYLYALWIVLCFTFKYGIAQLLSQPDFARSATRSQWFIMGGVILLAGIAIFVRFLRNNPKVVAEELSSASEV